MAMKRVPTVNLEQFTKGNEREVKEFIEIFGGAIKHFGFIVVEGHGIETQLIRDAYKQVETFFALPESEKKKYDVPGGRGQRGYTGFGKEHAKDSNKGDLKEFWHVGREEWQNKDYAKTQPQNVWPDAHVESFRPVLSKLYSQLDGLSRVLLEATSEYLSLPRQTLPSMVQDGNSILRCLHYPPLAPEHFKSGAVRAAAHEDINFITILCEATESGLELLTREGEWLAVESGPGQMVVDSGDMLSRICNDVIPSTTHRVVNPANARNTPRYSMPFFVHPFSTCKLDVLPTCTSPSLPPKYAPTTADAFLMQRLREIGLY